MPKRSYTLIAEHFGTDAESIRDCEYQPGHFSKPVYSLSDNEYWAAGATKPRDRDRDEMSWEKVISSYDRKSILWVHRQVEKSEDFRR